MKTICGSDWRNVVKTGLKVCCLRLRIMGSKLVYCGTVSHELSCGWDGVHQGVFPSGKIPNSYLFVMPKGN
jgi:hypothetical protein